MSKKILKRSLALGALMAFVITGQAWAADVVRLTDNTTIKITDSQYLPTDHPLYDSNKHQPGHDNSVKYIGNYNLNGYNLNVLGMGIQVYSATPYSFVGTGNLFIDNESFYKDKNYPNYYSHGLNGTGFIDLNGNLTVNSGNNTITVLGDTEIKANNITLYSFKGNTLQVQKNLDMTADANMALYSERSILRATDGAVVKLAAANIYMNANEDCSVKYKLSNDYAVKATDGATVNIGDDSTKNIVLNAFGDTSDRFNAIVIEDAGTTVKFDGDTQITTNNDGGRADAVKVDGGAVTFNDSATITTTAKEQAYGIVAMNNADVNLADTEITTTGNGLSIGIVGSAGADIDLAATTISATSEGSRADGMNLENATVNVTGKLTIDATGKADSDKFGAQGVRLAESTAQFADVDISVKSTTDGTVYGIRMLGDNNTTSTQLDISGNADVYAETNGVAYGIIVSTGANVDLKDDLSDVGKNLKVTVKGKEKASAIRAQYGSDINVSADTDVDIISTSENGNAYGVVNSYLTYDSANYAKANANISILGNVNIEANGKTGSYAVYNSTDYNKEDAEDVGNTIIGGEGKKVTITGDMYANSGSITTTFGAEGSQFDGKVETVEEGATTLNFAKGATWNLTGASTLTNATFDAGSTLVIDGETFDAVKGSTAYALNGVGSDSKLTVKEGANLTVTDIAETTYNIAKGFGSIVDENNKAIADGEYWNVNDVNTLMQGTLWTDGENGLQLKVFAKEAETLASDMNVSESTAQSLTDVTAAAQQAIADGAKANANGTGKDKAVALVQAMANANPQAAGQAFEAVSKMAEAGGNSGTAARVVNNVTGVTNDRLSFNCGHSAPHKGGHGVGLFEEGSGADIWVEYVHGKDKVEDMPSTAGKTSYEGQYNGIVMGVDFKKVNKFQSGIAFNYGEGDTNSIGSSARTHSEYDFWGIGYYGNIHNDDSNVIFDISYAKTDSEVESKALDLTYNASPETTTWTAGVKVEKLYQNENVQIVPYTGLRFMSIDPEDYTTECASSSYKMERQNIWLLPMGVSIRQEIANDNGWTVSPRVDLSYIWAFGDTDSEMEFTTLDTKTPIGYEVMDDGSFLGLVGIEAHKGQWGFGVSYSYQKGDHSESKKWFIDANYSF